jgi:uncharacterized cupredoxin-like copper-binding protein
MPLHGATKEREGEKTMKRRRFAILFAAALVALVAVCGVSACGGGAGGGAQQKAQEGKKKVEEQAQEAKKKAGKKVQQGKQQGKQQVEKQVQEGKKKVEEQAQEAKKKAGKKVQQGKQSGAKGSVAKTIQVKETEFRLKPAEITLDKPGTYLFKAVNSGGTVHALEVEGEGIEEETEEIEPGQSAKLAVKLKAGTYEVYCPVDGHKEEGMEGKVIVKGGSGGSGGY